MVNPHLDESQEALGVGLPLEGLRAVVALVIQSEVADLITARWQPPDVPESPVTWPVAFRHQDGACGAAGPASAASSASGGPPDARRALPQGTQIKMAHWSRRPALRMRVFLADRLSSSQATASMSPRRRVAKQSASPKPAPGLHSPEFGAYEKAVPFSTKVAGVLA